MKLTFTICILLIVSLALGFILDDKDDITREIINGVSLVNPSHHIDTSDLAELKRINCQWVAVIPYAFSRQNQPGVYFNSTNQWWGETESGSREIIKMAKSTNYKVMLKPHVWLMSGWIGDFDLDDEKKWLEWEKAYENYILTFARLAEEMHVDLYCIGTEYEIAVVKRPEFWENLISKVRTIYQGPLTYASNWDSFEVNPLWQDLDYIGIDAYFPLVKEPDPGHGEIMDAWYPIKEKIADVQSEYKKQVLFTEYGYQSANGAAGNHWEVSSAYDQLNHELQARAYECLYQVFWNEPWFAGGFLWKWHFSDDAGGPNNGAFTPQRKTVESVITDWYGR